MSSGYRWVITDREIKYLLFACRCFGNWTDNFHHGFWTLQLDCTYAYCYVIIIIKADNGCAVYTRCRSALMFFTETDIKNTPLTITPSTMSCRNGINAVQVKVTSQRSYCYCDRGMPREFQKISETYAYNRGTYARYEYGKNLKTQCSVRSFPLECW